MKDFAIQSAENDPGNAMLAAPTANDTAVVTESGTVDTVVISGVTYTGKAYSKEKIGEALTEKSIVAAQGVSYEKTQLKVNENKTFVVDTISMSGNTVTENGGAIRNDGTATISGSTFSGNTVNTSGAIYNDGNGGAIYNYGTTTISESTFTGNASKKGGGAVYVCIGTMTIEKSIFFGNVTNFRGGAIGIREGSTVTVKNSLFADNTADGLGGAIANEDGALMISGSTFTGNAAAWRFGGAVYISGGTTTIESSIFSGNTVTEAGGAVYIGGTTTIRDSIFATATDTIHNDSTLTLGGTIRTAANISSVWNTINVENDTHLVLDLSVYAGTTSKELLTDFHTMFFRSQNNLTISINIASDQAYGEYVLATNVRAISQQNFTVTFDGDSQKSFTASVGGTTTYGPKDYTLSLIDKTLSLSIEKPSTGIVTSGGTSNTVVIGGLTYTGTAYKESEISQALVSNKIVAAQDVTLSGLTVSAGKTFVGDVLTISGNTVTEYGGAIYNDGSAVITKSIFTGDAAGTSGGAIYNDGTLELSGSTFSGNTAKNGSAVYNQSGTVAISGSTFSDNTATFNGGVLFNNDTITISDSVFSGNKTVNGRGGVLVSYSGSVTIRDSVFIGNTAGEGIGGAIATDGSIGELMISGSTFTNNVGARSGGAIYNSIIWGRMTIRDSVFMTASDTVWNNKGEMILGGTIWTAANIYSVTAVTVEENTQLVLDLSVYAGTTSKELLKNFDQMLSTTQGNLAITVNVASDQTDGTYILATTASQFDLSKTISVVCNGNEIGTFNLQGGTTSFISGDKKYLLALDNGTLSFSVEEPDTAIVTTAGTATELTIGAMTYQGKAYSQDKISQALTEKKTVAAQGVSYENKNLTVAAGTTLVADEIMISNGIAGFGGAIADNGSMTVTKGLFSGNRADNDGGAVLVSGTATISGSTFAANSAKRGGAIYVGDTALISGCTFTGNAASTGGAIYMDAGAKATIKDSVFAKRYDTIYNQGGVVTLEGTITLAARMDGDSYICSVNGVDLVFVNNEQVTVSNLTDTGNLRSLTFHGTQEVSFSDLTLADTSISIKCGLPPADTAVTVAAGISSLGNSVITVNGGVARDGIVFIDGVFCTVGLENKNLQIRRADSVEAAIVCPDFKKGTIGEVTINGVRYSGLVYEDISSASQNSHIVAVQGNSTSYKQTILANNIGVIDNSWFNYATTTKGNGAAINLGDNSKTTITGSTFTDNYNNSQNGGAIGAESGAEVTLRSCTFFSNTSTGQLGGAIYVGTNSLMTITGSTFTSNTAAQHAGAIVVDRCGTLDIADCVFAENIAANGNGGAIYLQREGTATITGCTFTGNIAGLARTGHGGAISVGRDSKLLVSDCTFSGNTSVNDAGAIHSNGTGAQTTIKDCVFATKNDSLYLDFGTVTFAGRITLAADVQAGRGNHYSCSSEKVDFIFTNAENISIAQLSDTQNIRSMAFNGASPVEFTDLALRDITISIDGVLPGARQWMTVARGLTSLDSGTFTVHGKNVVGDKVFVDDYLYKIDFSGGELTIRNVDFIKAGIVTPDGASWIEINGHLYGGNVFTSINAALEEENFVVVQNYSFGTRSSVNGAGKQVLVDRTLFTGSHSTEDGGVIADEGGIVTIIGSTFSDNSARMGGAVAADDGKVSVTGSTFSGNTAGYTGGGAIYIDEGSATVSESVFSGNTAEKSGGAIYNDMGDVSVENSIFTDNFAGEAGGAINSVKNYLTITGSTFSGNAAGSAGGAIWVNSSTANITDCVFATVSDTVYNIAGTLTLEGTIWTAANITSDTAVRIEPDTKLVLDLSVYAGTTSKELLSDYNTMFSDSQNNLSITVNVGPDQMNGTYVLATGTSQFAKSITLVCGATTLGTFDCFAGGTTSTIKYNDISYTLGRNEANDLTLTVKSNVAIYVNSFWAGTAEGTVVPLSGGGTAIFGTNAFATTVAAKKIAKLDLLVLDGGVYKTITAGKEPDAPELVSRALRVDGGTFGSVFGGNWMTLGAGEIITYNADSDVEVNSGSVGTYLVAGDYVQNGLFAYRTGNNVLTVTGGEIAGRVIGGNLFSADNMAGQTKGNISITLSGGNFKERIYGGNACWGLTPEKIAYAGAHIHTGDISITLDASQNALSIGENIVCGSYRIGAVVGSVTLTVKGTGGNLAFGADSVVSGGSGDGYFTTTSDGKRTYENYIDQESVAVFDGFSGDFSARIALFDKLDFRGASDVNFTAANSYFSEIGQWSFADNAQAEFAAGQKNDFTDDTLVIDTTNWDTSNPWTLLSGDETAFAGFEAFASVTIGTSDAGWDGSKWVGGGFTLSLDEDKKSMILAKVG